MFDFTWSNPSRWRQERDALSIVSLKPTVARPVQSVALLHWEEHCQECVVPHCYGQCPLYRARQDRRCLRTEFGFVRDQRFYGILAYGVDVQFRRWAKLESGCYTATVPVLWLRVFDFVNRAASRMADVLSRILFFLPHHRRMTWALAHIRNRVLSICSRKGVRDFSAFVMEGYSLEQAPISLVIQIASGLSVTFRHVVILNPGFNSFQIPCSDMIVDRPSHRPRISVFSPDDLPVRVIFTWLDLVRFRDANLTIPVLASAIRTPAPKVKCIAWDLDNTLWEGVLIEDGQEHLRLKADVMAVIRELDQRGVIHTIVSKNTHEQAWKALQDFGVSEYFVFPAINWGPKSANLRQVAERLNINLDSIAFVDDVAFERDEVASQLPMVRVYSDTQVTGLPKRVEFDLPVTEMSIQRRLSYLAEMQREEFRAAAAGDNLAFLRSCDIRMRIFRPEGKEERERCLELIQRSNQLNLSARRYDAAGFEQLLIKPGHECFGLRCFDRFGAYGVVGFVSVAVVDEPQMLDLVVSCRVAKRHVEHALIRWLGLRYESRAKTILKARLVRTPRNTVLADVFRELPFELVSQSEETIDYVLELGKCKDIDDIVHVIE